MSRILLRSLRCRIPLYPYIMKLGSVANQNSQAMRLYTRPCVYLTISKRNSSRPAVAEQILESVDMKINKLDQMVKRLGRTNLKEVESILNEIEAAGSISVTQSLMVIRSCGSLLVEVKPEKRTELVHKIWKILQDLDVKLDISHYNALLRVYLENNYSFAPSDILSEIERSGLEPNRVTCQRLISRYCEMGDIAGATRVLQFMREKGMPINESVFNALIGGHSEVKDMESAENILKVMKESGIEPSSETYTLLICGYIKNKNLAKVEELFKQCESLEIVLTDKDYFDIIYAYATHGYEDEIDNVINKIRRSATYNHDAMNFTFKLLTANKPEIAYKILKSMLRATRPDGSMLPVGNFFIAHLIRNNAPTDLVIKYCRDLMNENLNPRAVSIALENAVRYCKTEMALELFREAKKSDLLPIRQHYFWPLIVNRGKNGDIDGLCDILSIMNREFDLLPSSETIREYVIPFMLKNEENIDKILLDLRSCGISTSVSAGSAVVHLLDEGKMKKAAAIASEYVTSYIPRIFRASVIGCFYKTLDVDSFITLIQGLSSNIYWYSNRETEGETENNKLDHREYIGEMIERVVQKLLDRKRHDVAENLLQKLVEAEIGIDEGHIKSIQASTKDVLPSGIVTSLEKLSSDEFATPTVKSKTHRMMINSLDDKALERLYEMAKTKGEKPGTNVKRMLFISYAKIHDLEKMKQMKEELEADGFIWSPVMHVFELDTYVRNDKLEEALQIYQNLCDTDPNFCLNPVKTLNLVALLVNHEQYDKAYEVLKKRFDLQTFDGIIPQTEAVRTNAAFKILNKLAEVGEVEKVKEFFNLMVASKFVEPSNYLLGPLIRAYIKREDYEGAMKEFENCVHKYKATPLKNELAHHFIEKGDAASLQKLTDLSTQVHGEMNSLVDLMFVFLEGGRVKQAKKVLETPGLRIGPERLRLMCTNLVEKGEPEHLINLINLTKHIAFVDRASIYDKLLTLYEKQNDAQSSLSLWIEIQEENIQPSDSFLITLADLLKANHMAVPFVVPEKKISSISRDSDDSRIRPSRFSRKLSRMIQMGDLDGAVALANSGIQLQSKRDCSKLVQCLLEENRYAEAKGCFLNFISKTGMMIHPPVSRFLMSIAAKKGDVNLFEELCDKVKDDFKKKISFDNITAEAYLNSGRIEEYLSSWEKKLHEIKNAEELGILLESFPRTTILNVMTENPEYIPRVEKFFQKCIAIDEKCLMSSVMFNFYMIQKDYEKAEQIWNKYVKNSGQFIFNGILRKVQKDKDIELGLKLLSYLKGNPDKYRKTLSSIYSHLVDAYVERNEIEEGKKCLDEALTEVPIDILHIKTLESLRSACLEKHISFPYTIPGRYSKRNKSDKGSDSDSD